MSNKVSMVALFLVALISFSNGIAQNKGKRNDAVRSNPKTIQEKKQERVSPEVLSLLDEARLSPAEFRSDALIRLATSRLVRDNSLKIELLKEAFDSAADAQFQVKKALFSSLNADTRAGYLANAYDLNLDALSLRCRAVDALLAIDKIQARDLFSQIQLKSYIRNPSSCKDALIYDIRAYYGTLRNVADKSFDKNEIEEGRRTRLIEEHLNDISSPIELGPAASLIVALDLTANELRYFVRLYSVKIKQISSDYRTFYASEVIYSTVESIDNLMSHCEKRDLFSRELVEAYRDYLIRNLSQEACDDGDEKETGFPHFVRSANYLLFRQNPIAREDIKTQRGGASFEESPFWTSSKSKRMLNETRNLRFNQRGEELTITERQTPEWSNRFYAALNMAADWRVEDEIAIEDYLNQKAVIFQALLEIAPTARHRDEALERFLNFLRDFDVNRVSRVEWYWHITAVLKQIYRSDGKLRTSVLDRLSGSENPVLKLYTSLSAKKL